AQHPRLHRPPRPLRRRARLPAQELTRPEAAPQPARDRVDRRAARREMGTLTRLRRPRRREDRRARRQDTMKAYLPLVYAAGIATATALALVPETGEINWRAVGLAGGKAFLAALGITALIKKTTD